MINLELNITLRCNLFCVNCNRLCHIYRDRTDDMSIPQIEKFIEQARNGGGVQRLKIIGGEPLMHPNFVEIYNLLVDAAEEGVIKSVIVETNKTLNRPDGLKPSKLTKWQGTLQRKKRHLPILWSPKDLGVQTHYPCRQISRCGFSLDKYGYLPCSLSIMMVRIFKMTHLYRYEFPTQPWGLDELCPICIFSMDKTWRSHYSQIHLWQHTEQDKTPTESYKKALDEFNQEEFYKTQKEF